MKSHAILLGTLALAISGAVADNSSAPAIDTQALLKQLKTLKTQSSTQTNRSLSQVIQQVRAAAASDMSAIALYEQCQKINHFEGKNTGAGDFAILKRKQTSELQNGDTKAALRLRLTYLALTLEKASGESPKTLAPAVWDYIKQISTDADHIDFGFLGSGGRGQSASIADSEVARGLQCASYLKNLKDWELNPADGYAIFKNSLRPLLIAEKDPRISQYWDAMIDLTARRVAKTKLLSSVATFNTVQKPQMLWDRAQDIVATGDRNAGIAEMMRLIKSNTTHPNVATWISTLEEILKNDATASASPVASPTPPLTTSAPAPAPTTVAPTPAANAPANSQPAASASPAASPAAMPAGTPLPAPAPTPENYPPDLSILPGASPSPTATDSPANH